MAINPYHIFRSVRFMGSIYDCTNISQIAIGGTCLWYGLPCVMCSKPDQADKDGFVILEEASMLQQPGKPVNIPIPIPDNIEEVINKVVSKGYDRNGNNAGDQIRVEYFNYGRKGILPPAWFWAKKEIEDKRKDRRQLYETLKKEFESEK